MGPLSCVVRISTRFVESTINRVISRRFVKKQQMRWTPRGAHLQLQVRVNVLNGDCEKRLNAGTLDGAAATAEADRLAPPGSSYSPTWSS